MDRTEEKRRGEEKGDLKNEGEWIGEEGGIERSRKERKRNSAENRGVET